MTVEVLFHEFTNLYGEQANMDYLKACAPDAEFIYTDRNSPPKFATDSVDLIYIGSMAESKQIMALNRLLPYAKRLKERIESGTVVLVTGNAMELFGEYILDGTTKIETLGLFPFHADRHMDIEKRHNSMFLGDFDGIEIVGYRSQFSFCRGDFSHPFIKVLGGIGNSPEDRTEGIHYKNFFATYLLGPFLVLNPLFTQYLLRLLKQNDSLAFSQEIMDAYKLRLSQLKDPDANFHID